MNGRLFFVDAFCFFFTWLSPRPLCSLFFCAHIFQGYFIFPKAFFLVLVLYPIGTFDLKKAQEAGFVSFWIYPFYSYLVAVRSSVPIFFHSAFLSKSHRRCAYECARNIFIFILKPDIASRTSFLASRSSLLPLLFPLFNTRFSVLISLLAARCLVLSACCSLLAILGSQNL